MSKIFTAFLEHKDFKKDRPWSMVRQRFDRQTISPPHYAETIEILICKNIVGTAHIGGQKFDLSGDPVFFIPPQTVHAFDYAASDGVVLALKWHPTMLKEYLNIDGILAAHSLALHSLAVVHGNLEAFYSLAEGLDTDTDIAGALTKILAMLSLFVSGTEKQNSVRIVADSGSVINEIINWTEQNYSQKISLFDVSARFGYTKNYFCDLFKAKTGVTYLSYLHHVRISNACALLRTGLPVSRVATLCGFETASYFISLFKKTVGVTPKAYQGK